MNDLIIITSYHPTLKQEDMLRNLVNNISSLNEEFDMMISSHSYIPKDICDKVDYVIYDKENKILTGEEYRATLWLQLADNYKIYTRYVGGEGNNTTLAVWKLAISACSLAKSLGYNKIHMIEYDTIITNLNELKENSKILDEYDTIFYSDLIPSIEHNIPSISGMVQSFKLENLIPLFQSYNEEKIIEFYNKKWKNIPEILRHLAEIENNNKIYYKDVNLIKDNNNGITCALVHRSNNDWYVPYYDPEKNELRFLARKVDPSKPNPKIELVVNDKLINPNLPSTLTYWSHFPLIDFNQITLLKVFINNKLFYEIDFTDLNKEEFKSKNYVEYT